MASTPAQSVASASRTDKPSLPQPSSHQLSKRQQYDTLLHAETGASSSTTSLGAPSSHPSYPAVAPLCRRYPTQAPAIFQAYIDLKNGAAAWDLVEALALSTHPTPDTEASAETARRDLADISDAEAQDLISSKLQALKTGTARLGLVASTNNQDEAQELLQAGIAAIKGRRKDAKAHEFVVPLTITQHLRPSQIDAIFTLVEAHAAACPGEDVDTSRVMLAIIAPDSTLVYYQISKGMVKPIN